MLPHLGAGAGQGIEDAYVLTELLSHPQSNRSNIEVHISFFVSLLRADSASQAVLRAYDTVRVPRASSVALASKRAGDTYDGHGPSGGTDEGILKDVQKQWEDVWHHAIRDEVTEAERILEKEGAFSVSS
jgi:salicylate hydroxylase